MLAKFRSTFIVLVFEIIGNISYLSKYILWLLKGCVIIGSIIYRSISKSNGFRFSFSVNCQVVQKILKSLYCLLLKGK